MNIINIINKKRLNEKLSKEELKYLFSSYMNGDVKDYQMSAFLMAICINSMDDEEIFNLTDIFINSGHIIDLKSKINGVTVDKHSTGGVGDKTTLVISPICASLGLKIVKMSGRGLGHTGGTIDKLESIEGFQVELSEDEIIENVNKIGMSITSQTKDLAVLDKQIYALRDVTATVESIPLIASSIMSKKIASGAENIVIDIKVGKGALIKNMEDANNLSNIMRKIGDFYNRKVETVITNMDTPLGTSIGNALEVIEAINILQNKEKNYLTVLCKELASKMVSLAKNITMDEALKEVEEVLSNNKAYEKFVEFVQLQKGDINKIEVSKYTKDIYSTKEGIITKIDAYKFGNLLLDLGGGRKTKEEKVDYSVGIVLNKTLKDKVHVGDVLCTLYIKEGYQLDKNIEDYFTLESDNSNQIIELLD